MKALIYSLMFFSLLGCTTLENGSIKHTSEETTVVQPSNAEKEAVVDSQETNAKINVGEGSTILVEQGLTKITSKGNTVVDAISKSVFASTGNAYKDRTNEINAIFSNTKPVMYTGIGLIVLGIVLAVIFKVFIQSAMLVFAGGGLIAFQSTLTSPLWTYAFVGGGILFAVATVFVGVLYHLKKNKTTTDKIVKAVAKAETKDSEATAVVKDELSKQLNDSEKKLIKKKKKALHVED